MQKTVFFILLLFSVILTNARGDRCASWTRLQQKFAEDPAYKVQFDEQERQLQLAIEQLSNTREQAGTVYTIPIVVHVVYNAIEENISDAQILSQITVLNKDYRFLNSDKLASSHPFYPLAGDAEIEFCLATKDPGNNNTTGIIRKATVVNGFTDDDKVKHNGTGGDDAWDATKYLNIWICKLTGGTLGYATFPGEPAATDGVVISYDCFGTVGTLDPTYNKGRTTTHEIGHWLNLFHIWGDDGNTDGICDSGECSGSDNVSDTPNQCDNTFGCPSGVVTDSCTTTAPGIMYENYMDYTDDACMNMFTHGQITRMRTALLTQRTSITTSNKCSSLSGVINQQDRSVRIYPNPVTNYLFIENLPQTRQNSFRIEIIDELGRIMKSTNYINARQEVEVSDLLNGYYVVRVFNDDFMISQKILILH